MAYNITFNQFVLDGVTRFQVGDNQRIAQGARPRRHAHLLHNFAWRDFRNVTLALDVWKSTEADMDTYLENLRKELTRGVGNLTRKDDGRYLKALMSSAAGLDEAGSAPATHHQFTIGFQCEPFWYAAAASLVSFLSQAPGANNIVTNNGKESAPPLIEVTGPVGVGETITITNTTIGMGMSFVGDLVAGQPVIFDHTNGRVLKSGSSALENIAIPNFWELRPGPNNLRYDGNDNANISVQWLERWP